MAKLILLRHLKSQWNLENRFTGWTDIPLSEEGIASAKEIAGRLADEKIDKIYTSPLMRNRETVSLVVKKNLPITINKALNERHYGKLQGLNKDEVKKQYGEERVRLWRRSWSEAPPEGESLKDVYERAVPFFRSFAEKDLEAGKNVLIVASHNSLRAIIKYLENIPDDKIIDFEITYGGLLEYEFDKGIYKRLQ